MAYGNAMFISGGGKHTSVRTSIRPCIHPLTLLILRSWGFAGVHSIGLCASHQFSEETKMYGHLDALYSYGRVTYGALPQKQ